MPGNNALPLSKAELVHTLVLVEKKGSTSAAITLGMSESALRSRVRQAKAQGLTATTKLISTDGLLKAKIADLKSEVRALTSQNESLENDLTVLTELADYQIDPPKWLLKPQKAGLPGVPMTIWSDWHWGETVFKEQVGGVNEFNRRIAKQRVKRLVDTTVHLAKTHMVNPNYPGIVVALGGDMITGGIHDELRETNDGPVMQSVLEVQDQIASALTMIADEFGKVFVPCVVGNHGRTTFKPRMKHRAYESYEYNIYRQLANHFRGDRRFQFYIPGESDAFFKVLGRRFVLTHGDSLGTKGGDGIIGAIGPIVRGATKVGRSESQIGRDFDTLLMGHWHTYIPQGAAAPVIANGSLIGYNEYARLGLRVPYSRPSQALWFVHPKVGITAQWEVFVDDPRRSDDGKKWVEWQEAA